MLRVIIPSEVDFNSHISHFKECFKMEPVSTEVKISGADNIHIKRKTVPPFAVHRSNPSAAVHL